MTPRQLDRRRRVIAAVHELIGAGSVRDLQVKDIADRAGVSLAAIYRYFSSKEHLLAEALLDWAERLTAGRRPTAASKRPETSDAFVALVRRGVSAYRRAPQFAELFLEVAASRDAHALACFGRMGDSISTAMFDALPELPHEVGAEIVRAVGAAWLGGLFDCVHRRSDFAGLERNLEVASRLLLVAAMDDTLVRR